MKIDYKQNKRDKYITLTIKLSFYELCDLAQTMHNCDAQNQIIQNFAEKLDDISEEIEEPL